MKKALLCATILVLCAACSTTQKSADHTAELTLQQSENSRLKAEGTALRQALSEKRAQIETLRSTSARQTDAKGE
ncbi:MAG: hypothetical protein Q9M31_09280 [Mariprofundus sp.]|nr:hypothetical protein [Mariprofundus sp.]